MKEVLAREGREAVSWKTALSTKGNRKRFLMITCVSVFSNWNGQAIVSYYLASVLNLVGITGSTAQTGINGGLQVVNWATSILGASLAESAGRRKIWLSSWGVMLVANVILTSVTAVYSKTPSTGVAGAVIFAIFLYDVGYSLACTPLLYAYETEIMPFHIRGKGMAYSVTIGQGQAIIFQYCNPIGLAKLGWKYYLVFLVFLIIQIIVIYFFFIETSGRTLEEVAALFDGEDATHQIELAGAQHSSEDKPEDDQDDKDGADKVALDSSARVHVASI
ncbi:hypothetical protein I317_07783 [Kwoniella heveanensis CBS 569]|nr:hypothetical protein I317_07783 [Kwoniella heveanensis CBS 569]